MTVQERQKLISLYHDIELLIYSVMLSSLQTDIPDFIFNDLIHIENKLHEIIKE